MSFNILLAGVGGQGLMLLSAVIGTACVASDIKVVTQEQHGLAQRSGSISAHVRIGEVYSPLIPLGSADQIIQTPESDSREAIKIKAVIKEFKQKSCQILDGKIRFANGNQDEAWQILQSLTEREMSDEQKADVYS